MGRKTKPPPPRQPQRDWLTPAEVAERLGISRPRVWQLMTVGRLPYEQAGPTTRLIPLSAVLAYEARPVGRPAKAES